VELVNSVLAVAVWMREALAQHPTVTSGDPGSFDRALADFRQVVDRCPLGTPCPGPPVSSGEQQRR
jgi:hypothetical protein